MAQSPTLGALGAALAKAQAQIKGAVKDEANPFFKSKYADLASVWDACREPLAANALAVVQTTEVVAEHVTLVTTLIHSSGEWVSGAYPVWPVKTDPQGYGSAVTYARRYSLAAMVGVFQVDDDGNAASDDRQPTAEDGVPFQDDYRIPFGKYAKRGLHEIDVQDLRSYINYLETASQKANKPMRPEAMDFIKRADVYIAGVERAPLEPGSRG